MSMFGDIAREGMAETLCPKIIELMKKYPESSKALREIGLTVIDQMFYAPKWAEEYQCFFKTYEDEVKKRFEKLFKRIEAKGEYEYFWNKIFEAYQAEIFENQKRYYHTLDHVYFCLREFDNIPVNLLDDRNTLEMAIILHDVIMTVAAEDNEEKSAEFAIKLCDEMKLPEDFGKTVSYLIIEGTKHDHFPKTIDAKILADCDLAILGQEKITFRLWAEVKIQQEFSFAPFDIFKERRIEILKRFLKRESIFITPYFMGRYESKAISNLEESIARLEK